MTRSIKKVQNCIHIPTDEIYCAFYKAPAIRDERYFGSRLLLPFLRLHRVSRTRQHQDQHTETTECRSGFLGRRILRISCQNRPQTDQANDIKPGKLSVSSSSLHQIYPDFALIAIVGKWCCLHQLSYAIKNQLKAPKAQNPLLGVFFAFWWFFSIRIGGFHA